MGMYSLTGTPHQEETKTKDLSMFSKFQRRRRRGTWSRYCRPTTTPKCIGFPLDIVETVLQNPAHEPLGVCSACHAHVMRPGDRKDPVIVVMKDFWCLSTTITISSPHISVLLTGVLQASQSDTCLRPMRFGSPFTQVSGNG
jgi:hypothetical protein